MKRMDTNTRKGYGILLVIFLFLLSTGCDEPTPASKRAGFLWKVTNGNNTVHLFGVIGIGVRGMYPLSETIYNAIDNADSLYLGSSDAQEKAAWEKSYGSLRDEAQFLEGAKDVTDSVDGSLVIVKKGYKGISDKGKSELIRLLGKSRAETKIEPYGFIAQLFTRLFNAELPTGALLADNEDVLSRLGIESHIKERLHSLHDSIPAKVKYLSSLDRLVALRTFWDPLPPGQQIIVLEEYLADFEDYKARHVRMVQAYRDGRLDEMERVIREEGEVMRKKVIPGNTLWNVSAVRGTEIIVDKITDILKREEGKKYFVIAGIGSCFGEDSVIEQIKREIPDAKIERVPLQ